MLLETMQARVQIADQDAVTDDRRMIFNERAAQRDHLLAQFLVGEKEIGRNLASLGSEHGAKRGDIRLVAVSLRRSLISARASFISLRMSRMTWRTLSGSRFMISLYHINFC
jgi:hypothetical protein